MRSSPSAPERLLRLPALLLAAAALVSCTLLAEQRPGTLVVRSARLDAPVPGAARLALEVDCALSGPMQDALEHGIPLSLRVDLKAGGTWSSLQASRHLELRWYPLSERYQLREAGSGDPRSFTTRAQLLAALGALRLQLPAEFAELPAATPLRVAVALDPARLPGALRLPAMFEPAWRLASAEFRWNAP